MDNIIKVPVKPIVRQYLTKKLGAPYPAQSNDLFGAIIPLYLTPDFGQRYQGTLAGQVDMYVKLPKSYRNQFLANASAFQFSLQMEKIFWKDAKTEILTTLINTRNKSFAMRQFYDKYEITEEMYPQDNFYRQMTRNLVPSAELKLGVVKKPMFNCVSDHDAREIAKLYNRERVSSREIGAIWRIDHKTVLKIAKKLKEKIPALS